MSDIGFVTNPLLRHSAERSSDQLARLAVDPKALTAIIAGEIPILRRNGAVHTGLLPLADLDRVSPLQEKAFLGTLEGTPVWGTLVAPAGAEAFRDDPAFEVLDLRSIAVQGVVPPHELGILAEAKALLHWHARHRFCANCGGATALACAGFRRDCGACGAQHFPRTDPVAIMLVARGDRCLLGRQSRFVAGMYSCLAGFIEPGETIEDAVRRETLEEAGVRVGAVRYLASQPWPFPASLMIGCIAEALSDELTVDREELEDARWFAREEVELMLDGGHPDGLRGPVHMAIAHHLMRSWLRGASVHEKL
jgi:NAD+ diphosphatase